LINFCATAPLKFLKECTMCNDQYPDESIVHTKLAAWHQWINGDMGTVGGGGMASLSEEACVEREKRKDVFRLPVVVSDAECTNRALSALMAQSSALA